MSYHEVNLLIYFTFKKNYNVFIDCGLRQASTSLTTASSEEDGSLTGKEDASPGFIRP
jgi:hypothetical protein